MIDACIAKNVSKFVFTSSVDAIAPLWDLVDVNEDQAPYPAFQDLVVPEYATTKQQSEKIVLAANGTKLKGVCEIRHLLCTKEEWIKYSKIKKCLFFF